MKTINTGPVAFLSSVSMAALIAVGVAQPARADTVWTGAVDQDWTNPDNWSTGAVPDGADDVVINGAGGTPFLTDAGGGAAQSLTVGDATGSAGLEIIEQGWLEISGDMIVSDPEGENHGEVRVSGPDASLTIDGSLTITDVNVYTSFMEIVDGAVVAVKGTTTVGKDAYLVLKGENGGNLVGEGALVLEGGLSIHPTSGLMVLDKDLIGSGEIWLHTGSGTVILQGYNTAFDGLIRMVEGEVETGSDHALGGSRGHAVLEMTGGTLRLNHQSGVSELGGTGGTVEMNDVYLFVHQDSDSVYSGALAGTGGLYKFGAGTLTLAGANSHAGHTIVEEGRLEVAGGSAIADSASVIVEQPGTFVVADSETLDGLGLYGGTVEIAAGQTLAAGQVLMSGGQLDGGTVEATGLEIQAGTVGSVLAGTGHVLKSGAGDATLSAQNTHTGGTTIEAGKLTVTGATGDVVVNGGVLGGNGTVGTIVAADGGTVAPGDGIATLTSQGSVIFDDGSVLAVETSATGQSDLLTLSGTAMIEGGVVNVTALEGYLVGVPYQILHADGGGTGVFDGVSGDTTSLFLDTELGYGAHDVYLQVNQALAFDTVAQTPNQKAAAAGADSLGPGHPVWDGVALIDDPVEANATFDALSGEIHASMRTALLDIGRALTEPTRARQRSADGGGTGGAAPSMVQGTPTGLTFWADGFGASGALDGDGNAAGADLSFGGLAAGADMLTQDGWRIGLAGGVARSDVNVASRSSSGTIDSQALALYFGRDWNGFSFRGGLAQGWHDIRTTRSVALSGGAQTLDGAYAARLTEVWAEASHEIETDRARFAPFVGLTHARLSTDGFSETGGTAALSVAAASGEATHATLGLRAETDLPLGNTHAVLGGMLAWQHAFGDTPLGQMEFVSGGDAFDISGVPPARDTALLGLEIGVPLSGNAALAVGYGGRFGSGVTSHAASLSLTMRF